MKVGKWWKSRPLWLRLGILGFLISIAPSLLKQIFVLMDFDMGFIVFYIAEYIVHIPTMLLFAIFYKGGPELPNKLYPSILGSDIPLLTTIINASVYVCIGIILGLIIQKIKSKKQI